jgi:hypothetical protein
MRPIDADALRRALAAPETDGLCATAVERILAVIDHQPILDISVCQYEAKIAALRRRCAIMQDQLKRYAACETCVNRQGDQCRLGGCHHDGMADLWAWRDDL